MYTVMLIYGSKQQIVIYRNVLYYGKIGLLSAFVLFFVVMCLHYPRNSTVNGGNSPKGILSRVCNTCDISSCSTGLWQLLYLDTMLKLSEQPSVIVFP